MMQLRSNTLKLGWRGLDEDRNKFCRICIMNKIETIEHFLLECPKLQVVRNKMLSLQLPRIQEVQPLIEKMMLLGEHNELERNSIISIVTEMWIVRNKAIKAIL